MQIKTDGPNELSMNETVNTHCCWVIVQWPVVILSPEFQAQNDWKLDLLPSCSLVTL